MLQIIFNEISASEISQLPTLEQLALLDEFRVTPDDLEHLSEEESDSPFGIIHRKGKALYRYRAKETRIYFEVSEDRQAVVVHRVLSRNSFQDFLYRAELPVGDDDAVHQSRQFWQLIEEGEKARRV